ncbi:hypothetical protein BDQ12DRAFT_694461 [Crucibulum laeve]|uniref:Uncharacterized protein n=1 Tax=Crucibulum laeve TaxID=68775 RepID=A0A5C3LEC7_9AGAR|nr:hypothetical protein BDQ12DRAFT_694461 [Crucibulum laeve]
MGLSAWCCGCSIISNCRMQSSTCIRHDFTRPGSRMCVPPFNFSTMCQRLRVLNPLQPASANQSM